MFELQNADMRDVEPSADASTEIHLHTPSHDYSDVVVPQNDDISLSDNVTAIPTNVRSVQQSDVHKDTANLHVEPEVGETQLRMCSQHGVFS